MSGRGGQEIAENRDFFGADPFLDLTLPADGRYVVKVHDVTYGGSPDHGYRLTLHDGPHLDAIVPAVAEPGVASDVHAPRPQPRGDGCTRVVDRGPAARDARGDDHAPSGGEPDPAYPVLGKCPVTGAPRRGFCVALERCRTGRPTRSSSPRPSIRSSSRPSRTTANDPQAVTLPCDISGTSARRATSTSIGSGCARGRSGGSKRTPSGSDRRPIRFFVVQKVVPNGPPQDLATGEDTADRGEPGPVRHGDVDARCAGSVPEDGTYQVAINDLFLSQRGDPRLAYRLTFRPETARLPPVPRARKQHADRAA